MFDRVVWLSGMPRSGTTWLGQILASHPDVRLKYCPLFSYEFAGRCDANSTPAQWAELLREVYERPSRFLDQEFLRADGSVPRFPVRSAVPPVLAIKSNRFHHLSDAILGSVPSLRWIAVVRHPAATIHSWITNPTEFPSGANPAVEWRTGACRKTKPSEFWGFEDWLRVTSGQVALSKTYPGRVVILHYDAFDAAPVESSRELLRWLGLELHSQTAGFLVDSREIQSANPRAVFKRPGNAQRWRGELDPSIVAQIERETVDAGLGRFLEAGGPAMWGVA